MVERLPYTQNVVSSNLAGPTKQGGCAAEWLGPGLQIRIMQVRVLSPTPVSFRMLPAIYNLIQEENASCLF